MTIHWRIAAVLTLSALLGACAGLPQRAAVTPTVAISDGASTSLGRIAARSRPDGETDPSGFRLLPTGESAFAARMALVARAERAIDAQYYDLRADSAGQAFVQALAAAAKRGVRVRLLVDDFYALGAQDLLAALSAQRNAEVRLFNPIPARVGSPVLRMLLSWPEFERVNHRMHNKLFVVDNAVAVYGGRNIADEYFMRDGKANFVDLDVLSTGQVVHDLSASFDQFWNSEQAYPIAQVLGSAPPPLPHTEVLGRLGAGNADAIDIAAEPPLDRLGQRPVEEQLREGRLALHHGSARVFTDPPAKVVSPVVLQQPSAAMQGQLQVLSQARTDVAVSSPYFLPSTLGMGLIQDARQRGIQTLVLTNSLGSTDEPLAHMGYARYRPELLRLGVELYELGPTLARDSGRLGNFKGSLGRLHAKLAVVDRRWLLVGSVNLDARSALYNTEIGVAIDCPPVAASALRVIAGDAFGSMYRVRRAADGQRLEWVSVDAEGQTTVEVEEPNDHWLARWRRWWMSLFVGEELL
ncbi:MAG: phospholipase D family protein [Ideonella sp.]|nr:phospholipase D family protein [Ideonella sp.]